MREFKVGPAVKQSKRKDLTYRIKEGQHYATRYPKRNSRPFYLWRRLWSILPFMVIRGRFQRLQVLLSIDPENWYANPNPDNGDWLDINKLVGVNFGLFSSPHKTSFRIGWRHNYETPGYVDLFLYYYIQGERTIKSLSSPVATVKTGEELEFTFMLGIEDKVYVNIWQDKNQLYTDSLPEGDHPTGDLYEDFGTTFPDPGTRYFSILEPYHGGNEKAPHDQVFTLHKIVVDYI